MSEEVQSSWTPRERCLCCRVKIEEEFTDDDNDNDNISNFDELSNVGRNLAKEGIKIKPPVDFDLFCSTVGISTTNFVFENRNHETICSSERSFCKDCSRVVVSLKGLQELLEKTKVSIQEKLDWIKRTVGVTLSTLGERAEEEDPRACFIRKELLESSYQQDYVGLGTATGSIIAESPVEICDGVEVKSEAAGMQCDDLFEATEFEIDDYGSIEIDPEDVEMESSNLKTQSQLGDVSPTPSTSKPDLKEGSRRGQKRKSDLISVSLKNNSPATRPPRLRRKNVRLADYVDPVKPQEEERKAIRSPLKLELSQSDKLLLIKFGLDKLPQPRILLKEMCPNGTPELTCIKRRRIKEDISLQSEHSEDQQTSADNDSDQNSACKLSEPKKKMTGRELRDRINFLNRQSMKSRAQRNRLNYSIKVENGKFQFRSGEIVREGNYLLCPYKMNKACEFKVRKDKCDMTTCTNMSEHLKRVHPDDNYWCESCQVFCKYQKEFARHNKCKVQTNIGNIIKNDNDDEISDYKCNTDKWEAKRESVVACPDDPTSDPEFDPGTYNDSNSDRNLNSEYDSDFEISRSKSHRQTKERSKSQGQKRGGPIRGPRNRLTYFITIENGKKYYRKKEIVEDGNYILCPYKMCKFRMLKDPMDTVTCADLQHHFKTAHPDDNYWCKYCKKFYKYQKEFFKHRSKCQKRFTSYDVSDTSDDDHNSESVVKSSNNPQPDVTVQGMARRRRPRQQPRNEITIEDGKQYFRSEEIREKDGYLLCPMKTCTFELLKDESEMTTCSNMLDHIKSVHSDDNYWCRWCKTYFKYTKQFIRHDCKGRADDTGFDNYEPISESSMRNNDGRFKEEQREPESSDLRKATPKKVLTVRKQNGKCNQVIYRKKTLIPYRPRNRLKCSIQIRDGKRYYRSQEIVDDGNFLLCPYSTCGVKIPKNQIEASSNKDMMKHIRTVHQDDNYWCKDCQLYFKLLKDLEKHNSHMHSGRKVHLDPANFDGHPSMSIDIKRMPSRFTPGWRKLRRNRLKNRITIVDGVRYFRSQEIAEKGNVLLCPYKSCKFEMAKDEDEIENTSNMLEHLKVVHSDENYWCAPCQKYFKYSTEFVRHKCGQLNDVEVIIKSEGRVIDGTNGNMVSASNSSKEGERKRRMPRTINRTRSWRPRRRLPNFLTVVDGKKFYRSLEILEKDNYLHCPYKETKPCEFKSVKTSPDTEACEDLLRHIKAVHPADNYWCDRCRTFFPYLKDYIRHKYTDHCMVEKKPEVRKTSSIDVIDGKAYFQNQEVLEKGGFWLCVFDSCDFKMLKNEDDRKLHKEMLEHFKQHCPDRKYQCEFCEWSFETYNEKEVHRRKIHPGLDKIECQICQKPISSSNYTHSWTHLNADERRALVAAGHVDPSVKQRENILKRKPEFKCKECGKQFAHKPALLNHSHVPVSERPKIICEECGNVYTTLRGLMMHRVRTHDPESFLGRWKICLICEKKFVVQTHLDIHMMRHHGTEKKFLCEKCPKKFPSAWALKKHGVVHTDNPTPWKCPYCDSSYRYSNGRARHIRKCHPEKNYAPPTHKFNEKAPQVSLPVMTCQRMFPCEICGDKYFPLRSRLKKHMTSAHGQKYVYDDPFDRRAIKAAKNEADDDDEEEEESQSEEEYLEDSDGKSGEDSGKKSQVEVDAAVDFIVNEGDVDSQLMFLVT